MCYAVITKSGRVFNTSACKNNIKHARTASLNILTQAAQLHGVMEYKSA